MNERIRRSQPPGRWGVKLALATAALGTLTACVGTGPTHVATPQQAAGSTLALDPNAILWAVEAGPTTLDPARMVNDPSGAQVAAQVYDRLVRFRPGTVELAPGIATNWVADPEGRTFTFTLRDGMRFHDGSPLDAVAVVWNFERWMNPDHPAHQGEFRPWRDYFGGFVGEKDDQGRAINLVARVQALDPRTVRIMLHAPFAPFLHDLAMVSFGFASPAAVRLQGEAYAADGNHLPVGSGPFRVVSWTDEGAVALAPFADYWSGPPAATGLGFTVLPDPSERAEAVAAGRVHGADLPPTTAITGSLTSPSVRVMARPPRANAWLMLNHSRDPLGDVRVRRAISLAIDRERLAEEHFGPEAIPCGQLLPPGLPGHDESLVPPPRDLKAARAALVEAGVGDGFKLNIWVASSARGYLPDPSGTADAVAAMLKEIGLDTSVRSENMRQFLIDRDRGRFTAWIIGWEAQSGDPDNFWFWHFGAGRLASEGQYVNRELAASLLSAQRTIDTAQRAEIYRAAAWMVDEDVARIFLACVRPLVSVSRRVRDYEPGPMGFDDFRSVTLAPAPEGAATMPPATDTSPPPTETAVPLLAVTAVPLVTGEAEPLDTSTIVPDAAAAELRDVFLDQP